MAVTDTSVRLEQGDSLTDHRRTRSEFASDTVVRTIAIFALIGVALVHFVQIVDTFRQSTWLGLAFLVLILTAMALAIRLLRNGGQWAWLGSGLISIAAILGYIFTRTVSTPVDTQDVGNWAETLGLAALFVEGLLVVLSGHVVVATLRSRTNS